MRYRTILLAIDVEADNTAVIDYAFAFAEKAGATLHTLYACPVGIAAGGSEETFYAKLREHAKSELKNAVARHLASQSIGKGLINVNEPIAAILSTASAVSADLIIVSTHARQGTERVIMGSVAEGVLDEAKVPVLVMRSP